MTNRLLAAVVASMLMTASTAHAQFSDSFNFLKAIREADGAKVEEIVKKPGSVIINTRDTASGETALHIVTKRRDETYLAYLLARQADPNLRDSGGRTPLWIAAQMGWAEGLQQLIAHRANVELADGNGETPLNRAVQNRDIAAVRLLLAAGANPKRPDNAGLSALDHAVRDGRSPAIVKELQDAKPVVRREIAGPH